MRRFVKFGVAVTVGLVAVATPALASDRSASTQQINLQVPTLAAVGLTDAQRLVRFETLVPGLALFSVPVSGLNGDAALIGIDYRVQNGLLYGVGNAGGIYTVTPNTGAATKVSQLSVALAGTSFGVDFNPAANRLRVISDTGQNLRHNIDDPNGAPPVNTTVADAPLTTPPAAGTTTGVTSAGYTNNDLAPTTATTLFDVNTANDTLVVQSPANAGTLAATGQLTVDAGSAAGLDVYSRVRNGTAIDNTAFATFQVGGGSALYEVNLLTGTATSRGTFPPGTNVVDIAIPLNQQR